MRNSEGPGTAISGSEGAEEERCPQVCCELELQRDRPTGAVAMQPGPGIIDGQAEGEAARQRGRGSAQGRVGLQLGGWLRWARHPSGPSTPSEPRPVGPRLQAGHSDILRKQSSAITPKVPLGPWTQQVHCAARPPGVSTSPEASAEVPVLALSPSLWDPFCSHEGSRRV